ncbi:hypothetical protein JHK86_035685 [Glycine max]|nr:hypothetical protein JHK86_035685 [Glycine max]
MLKEINQKKNQQMSQRGDTSEPMQLGFDGFDFVEGQGFSEGIIVAWKKSNANLEVCMATMGLQVVESLEMIGGDGVEVLLRS